MHRGRTVLAMDCVLAGAQWHRGRPLNSVVRQHARPSPRTRCGGVCRSGFNWRRSGIRDHAKRIKHSSRLGRSSLSVDLSSIPAISSGAKSNIRVSGTVLGNILHLVLRCICRRRNGVRLRVSIRVLIRGMLSNKSFERTVKHRGRPVLAIDGVLGGAEEASWSAAQFNR
jgi:hypothetical protein